MSINIKATILESFPLSRSRVSGNRNFHFDGGINLSHCSIGIVEWWRIVVVVVPVVSGLILGASMARASIVGLMLGSYYIVSLVSLL